MTPSRNIFCFFVWTVSVMLSMVNVDAFPQDPRFGHGAVLVGDRLFISGGYITMGVSAGVSNEAFYIDMSRNFSTDSPPFTGCAPMPRAHKDAVVSGNDSNVVVFGGDMRDPDGTPDNRTRLWVYDSQLDTWNSLNVSGTEPVERIYSYAARDSQGKLFFFGGLVPVKNEVLDGLNVLDMTNLHWLYVNGPEARYDHAMVVLEDENILLIAGLKLKSGMTDMYSIDMYDSKSSTWKIKEVNGPSGIQGRRGASASVGNNGLIYILGGRLSDMGAPKGNASSPDLLILDPKTFTWIIPEVQLTGRRPQKGIRSHRATIVGDYLIITFGLLDSGGQSDIWIFNTKTNEWTDQFVARSPSTETETKTQPETATPTATKNSKTSSVSTLGKIFIGVAVVVALIILIWGSCYFCRHRLPIRGCYFCQRFLHKNVELRQSSPTSEGFNLHPLGRN